MPENNNQKFSVAEPIKDWTNNGYNLQSFESDIQAVQPRFFDTYVLAPFMMWYAWKSKGMRVNTRRILFASGVYMAYRNYTHYKEAVKRVTVALQQPPQEPTNNALQVQPSEPFDSAQGPNV